MSFCVAHALSPVLNFLNKMGSLFFASVWWEKVMNAVHDGIGDMAQLLLQGCH
jgi:hypothetical protein